MKYLNTAHNIQTGEFIKALFTKSTPLYIKGMIAFALIYTIVPVDLLPDFLGPLAFLDDAVVIGLLTKLAMHLLERHQNQQITDQGQIIESQSVKS
ncbi:YkvA family protein [Ignavigranum ruoffiae]|uniref:DUF1232 domain-containing protein n=1 Tax=Ignavigranum ruoffiae TaxID=89093 RepID=A0A1H9G4W7_9LACT|nr:DUF1232 domain-containing protein [Ignavigranum ruoffiae]SEQ44818.1 Protein of unknown function [Ignavigranum ruoffiae]